jgi:hypothetical protein
MTFDHLTDGAVAHLSEAMERMFPGLRDLPRAPISYDLQFGTAEPQRGSFMAPDFMQWLKLRLQSDTVH